MSLIREAQGPAGDPAAGGSDQTAPGAGRGRRAGLVRAAEAWGLVGMWALLVLGFSIADPSKFVTIGNWGNIFGSQAVLFILAIATLVPLTMRDIDLSLGAITGLSAMTLAVLNVQDHMNVLLACLIAVAAAVCVSAVNALLIVKAGGDGFIITLAMMTVLTGIIYLISGSSTVGIVSAGLSQVVFLDTLLGIPVEFYIGVLIMVLVWYVLNGTPVGQRALIVGQSRDVARLSGVRVAKYRVFGYLCAGLIAGIAGIVYAATTGSVDPTSGTTLLLPAVAAVFLGATCVKPGRFNAPGTGIAVYFLATGAIGLESFGAQDYVQQLFYGAALVIAVVLPKVLGYGNSPALKLF